MLKNTLIEGYYLKTMHNTPRGDVMGNNDLEVMPKTINVGTIITSTTFS